MNRRRFLSLTAGAMAAGTVSPVQALLNDQPYLLEIAPLSIELAPGVVVSTMAYNGQVPGPVLRVKEGVPVEVMVANRTPVPQPIKWNGLHRVAFLAGRNQEDSSPIPPGVTRMYRFTPTPAGTRWYNAGDAAVPEPAVSTGQCGFLIVEPRTHPGNYDQELFLAAHHWEPSAFPADREAAARAQVDYRHASFNDKLLGAAEPLRVRQGQRVLFRILNASASEELHLSLPGHRFRVVALDGNAVPQMSSVEVLTLAVGERIDAVVEMNAPGTWILGSLNANERGRGLGLRIEYAHHGGPTAWAPPSVYDWSYSRFSTVRTCSPFPEETFELLFEQRPGEPDVAGVSAINGLPPSQIESLKLDKGGCYRLRLMNATARACPFHLSGHSFEVTRVNQHAVAGVIKDTINVAPYSAIDIDLLASDLERSLVPLRQRLLRGGAHMKLVRYA